MTRPSHCPLKVCLLFCAGRESKKSIKKKKMKEWNKKGENKEGGDMDAFVDREEVSSPGSWKG